MNSAKKDQRVIFFDVLRLMAFACIIIYHFVIEMEMHNLYLFSRKGITCGTANMHLSTFGVSLFFIISGAGLMLSTKKHFSLINYFKKRVLRILIPFYIVYFIYLSYRFLTDTALPYPSGVPGWRILFTL